MDTAARKRILNTILQPLDDKDLASYLLAVVKLAQVFQTLKEEDTEFDFTALRQALREMPQKKLAAYMWCSGMLDLFAKSALKELFLNTEVHNKT